MVWYVAFTAYACESLAHSRCNAYLNKVSCILKFDQNQQLPSRQFTCVYYSTHSFLFTNFLFLQLLTVLHSEDEFATFLTKFKRNKTKYMIILHTYFWMRTATYNICENFPETRQDSAVVRQIANHCQTQQTIQYLTISLTYFPEDIKQP